jgi:hypothetical protein
MVSGSLYTRSPLVETHVGDGRSRSRLREVGRAGRCASVTWFVCYPWKIMKHRIGQREHVEDRTIVRRPWSWMSTGLPCEI